jgi:hypothetical protein
MAVVCLLLGRVLGTLVLGVLGLVLAEVGELVVPWGECRLVALVVGLLVVELVGWHTGLGLVVVELDTRPHLEEEVVEVVMQS